MGDSANFLDMPTFIFLGLDFHMSSFIFSFAFQIKIAFIFHFKFGPKNDHLKDFKRFSSYI